MHMLSQRKDEEEMFKNLYSELDRSHLVNCLKTLEELFVDQIINLELYLQ